VHYTALYYCTGVIGLVADFYRLQKVPKLGKRKNVKNFQIIKNVKIFTLR